MQKPSNQRVGLRVVGWLALLLTASPLALANEAVTNEAEEAASSPSHIFPLASEQSGSGILADRDAYLASRGWSIGFHADNPGGSYIGWGQADILTGPTSPDYGGARIAAVDAAVTNAMGEFALSSGTSAQAELIRRVVNDPDALRRAQDQAGEDFRRAVSDRLKNLTTAQLDKALAELGVDAAEHQALDFSERVTLMEERMQARTARQAFESFRGVRLLKTFEEEGAVGALVIHNPRFAELASNIVSGNLAAIGQGVSSDAVDQIANQLSAEELLFMHGVRLLRDADGNPVIVAFGQQSPSVTRADSERMINMAITASERGASINADRAIAEFLGAQVEVEDQQLTEALAQVTATASGENVTQTESSQFVQNLNSLIRQRSQMDLTGITTVRSWRTNHPDTGHLYVGTVKMWSPTTRASFTGEARVQEPGAAEAEEPAEAPEVERRSSPDFGNEDW